MRIHCFGDSWTQGIGTEWEPGKGRVPMETRYDRNWDSVYEKYGWPGQLSNLFGDLFKVSNYGNGGCSNNQIYMAVIEALWENKIKKGDLVIVSWSSIIREPLNFMYTNDPHNGFLNYSNFGFMNFKEKMNSIYVSPHEQERFHWIDTIENNELKEATENVYKDYVVNRFSYDFLYEFAMNYVANLQIYFDNLKIQYIFINSFENIISENSKSFEFINKDKWILWNSSLQEYLLDVSKDFDTSIGYSVWEDDTIDVERNHDGPHPNRIGYGILAEKIFEEIKKMEIKLDGNSTI